GWVRRPAGGCGPEGRWPRPECGPGCHPRRSGGEPDTGEPWVAAAESVRTARNARASHSSTSPAATTSSTNPAAAALSAVLAPAGTTSPVIAVMTRGPAKPTVAPATPILRSASDLTATQTPAVAGGA